MVFNSISVPLNSSGMQDVILQECLRGLCLIETLPYRKYQSEKCCHTPLHKIKEELKDILGKINFLVVNGNIIY